MMEKNTPLEGGAQSKQAHSISIFGLMVDLTTKELLAQSATAVGCMVAFYAIILALAHYAGVI